ncbi:MAG: transglycosylase SLT domain-containing protein [Myxococcaceae bacterium]|nr:transglycosylase SLT domain-containing protein [Myxococcaceae bacterium]
MRPGWLVSLVVGVGSVASAERGTDDDPFNAEVIAEPPPRAVELLQNPAFPSEVAASAAVVDAGAPAEVLMERADLSPYFLEGKLREARQAFAQGAYTRAREKLDPVNDTNPVRFLRALAAFRARDFAFAGPEFEALAQTYDALADRCLVHAGWSFEGLEDFESAARVFERVNPRSRLWVDGQLGRARSLRRVGKWPAAIELLASLGERPAPPWGRDVGAEALLALADLHLARGDAKGEQRALAALWSKHPLSAQALKSERRLTEVEKLPVEVTITRADQLVDAHRNAQGLALVEPMLETLELPEPVACRAHFVAGKAQRKLRQHVKAVALLAPIVKKCLQDDDLRVKALYTLGFSQTITAPALAIGTWEALALDYPDHPLADDALFFAAEARQRSGDLEGAADRLAELADRFPVSDMGADGLFRLFWLRKSAGDRDGAVAVLDEIVERFSGLDDSHDLERAQYWRARLLEESGDRTGAFQALAANAAAHPATFYGLLSRERAEALSPSKAKALQRSVAAATRIDDVFPLPVTAMAADLQFRAAVELLRLGFGELVPMEILGIDRAALPPESHRLLVVMLAMAGEERPAHGMARLWLRKDLSGPITRKTRLVWEIAYPKAFREPIEASSAEADELDPDLLQALMREESALDPKALSWAGALGLCQLMPATAAQVAAQLKLPRPSTAALLEPDLNIRLGARYLSDLMIRFEGVKPFAVASYNAGPNAVARWRRELPIDDLPAWVEQIPIQETRNYVKRVLRSYNTYKLLYSPDDVARTVGQPPAPKPAKADKKV